METIIKYELTINKAIRASLEHGTPDEQINAFIRFLGKEIGADRIYIFEDSQKENITNNTYEWCADGVKPEIDNLQELSMDVIKWWYDYFEKDENIIIRDMEEIKEEYPDSYKLLRGQNIDRLVVSSFGSDCEIRGFFGVDNPPESDFRGLTVFLDMIASLIVSLLKIRNKDIESKRMAQFSGYSAFAQIYISIHYVNIQTRKFNVIKKMGVMLGNRTDDCFDTYMKNTFSIYCAEEYLQKELAFVDLDTIEKRLGGRTSIVSEFYGETFGWCRGRMIPVDFDSNGRLLHVIYCIESIDEQKERENSLLNMAQTDFMTGIWNRRHGEKLIEQALRDKVKGMMCIIDCDKFKSINDTYGHAVGDEVIIAIAHALKNACRKDDIVMRLGGDEFAMFFPDVTERQVTVKIFKRIFENIEKIEIKALGGRKIILSLGACIYDGTGDISYDTLYSKADAAMYRSKKQQGFCATVHGAADEVFIP